MSADSSATVPSGHPIRGIDHVGLAVWDISDASHFYVTRLGMRPVGEPVELPDRGAIVQFLEGGAARVELLQPVGDSGPLARFLERRGEAMHHVCYLVDDIHCAVVDLTEAGVSMIDTVPWRSPHGWAAYIHPASAHGCAIELREHYR